MTDAYPKQTLRIPRGLWRDLEETIIQQDRQFLMEIARQLGLPPQDVIKRCLGTAGVPTSIPVLWGEQTSRICPWWDHTGTGLWKRCPRTCLSDTLPCYLHERCVPCPLTRLDDDPYIESLPRYKPVRWEGKLYWYDPEGVGMPFREDGTYETKGTFYEVNFKGKKCLCWVPVSVYIT